MVLTTNNFSGITNIEMSQTAETIILRIDEYLVTS